MVKSTFSSPFLKKEPEAIMGDEDWEAEILKPHVSSYVPVFEKVIKLTGLLKVVGFYQLINW